MVLDGTVGTLGVILVWFWNERNLSSIHMLWYHSCFINFTNSFKEYGWEQWPKLFVEISLFLTGITFLTLNPDVDDKVNWHAISPTTLLLQQSSQLLQKHTHRFSLTSLLLFHAQCSFKPCTDKLLLTVTHMLIHTHTQTNSHSLLITADASYSRRVDVTFHQGGNISCFYILPFPSSSINKAGAHCTIFTTILLSETNFVNG